MERPVGNSAPNYQEKILEKERLDMKNPDYMVAFSGMAKSYCVGIVDMVNSTKISADMNDLEWCR